MKNDTKTIVLDLGERGYSITVGKDILKDAEKYFNLNRKVFIVTDSGVPSEYSKRIAKCALDAKIHTVCEGEGAKSFSTVEEVLSEMLAFGMTRTDCLVAVGGGVVGDLTGFLAAIYMRGIDFYNVPTTVLSEVDSSIGGKCAVNFGGVKNIVGAFHQPKAVLIDTDTLKTLDKRQFSQGLSEAVKMALTSDGKLFSLFENEDIGEENIQNIITGALMIKKDVVEKDEKEQGLRKILNFGHTLGHGIEAEEKMHGLLHGECVALGMIPMCSSDVRERLIRVLEKISLPTRYDGDIYKALEYVKHDKKCRGGDVEVIFVNKIGTYEIKKMKVSEYSEYIKRYFGV